MPDTISIAAETPGQPEILALLKQSDAFSEARYPRTSSYLVSAEFLAQPHVRFMVARMDGVAVGCGALVLADDHSAEIKRMIVDEAHRGQGIGRAVLDALEAAGKDAGVKVIRLETGPQNHDALTLYRRYGYHERGPFGAYPEDPHSVFMEKAVSA
jgi:putative acetyltransferase